MARNKIYIYNRRRARKKGFKDGRSHYWKFWPFWSAPKNTYPLPDQQEPAQYEKELCELADSEIRRIAHHWKHTDQKLKPAYCNALAEKIKTEEHMRVELADVPPEEIELKKASDELLSLEAPYLKHRVAVIFHILVFVFEFPFNAIVLSVMGFEPAEYYIAAGGLCLALTLGAYMLGKFTRQDVKSPWNLFFIFLIPIVVLGAIFSIAVLRSELISAAQQTAIIKLHLKPATAAVLFSLINILIFSMATIVSYASFHRKHDLFNTLEKRYRHALARLNTEKGEAAQAANVFDKAQEHFNNIKHQRQKEFDKHHVAADTVIEDVQWLISVYRTANMEKRRDAVKPPCFIVKPDTPSMPEELDPKNLDWDCEQLVNTTISHGPSNPRP